MGKGTAADVLRELHGVGDGGGAAQEAGRGAVVPADPPEALHHVGQMGAEGPTVGMKLVHHDVLQVGEEKAEAVAAVVRQKGGVEHFGVGEDDVRAAPDAAPLGGGGVPVVDPRLEAGRAEVFQERNEAPELVARQRLGGVQEDRPGRRVRQDLLQDGQQEAQGLAAGRGGGDDHVFAVHGPVEHLSLVGIEHADPAALQEGAQFGQHPVREGGEHRFPLRDHLFVDYLLPVLFHAGHGNAPTSPPDMDPPDMPEDGTGQESIMGRPRPAVKEDTGT